MVLFSTILIVIAAIILIVRRVDVRLVLIIAGVLLSALVGVPTKILDVFQGVMSRGEIIGPICTAMGYAFVLRYTGCDTEMVRLLVHPLRKVSWALVPGGIMIGFVTNMAITSQTAAAAAVGPILVPLLIAAGFTPVSAGATLLIGCSVGGNLFNPGEPDIVTVKAVTGAGVADVIDQALVPTLLSCAAAIVSLMIVLHRRGSLIPSGHQTMDAATEERPNVVRALLAPLPVLLLLLLQPRFALVPMIQQIWPHGIAVSAVMLICTMLVIVVTAADIRSFGRHASAVTVEFFSGMGYAFTNVISVIIAASCFLAGLEAVGAIGQLTGLIASSPATATVLSPTLTWILAVISGSGTAPSVAFSQAVLPSLVASGNVLQAITLGVFGAIGASIGRTMSPVSAVMHFSSTVSGASVAELVRLVWFPMVAALIATILYGLVFS